MLTNMLLIGAFAILTSAVDTVMEPALDAQLESSSTMLQRLALMPDNASWKFDFTTKPTYTFTPGGVTNANAATFPVTVQNELTMAILNLGPCSMLPPHLHPRATNYVVAFAGNTTTYMIAENGAPLITETLTPGQMTIFPRASLHSMQNTDCENNAQLVSALSSTDPGTHNVVNGLFSLPSNIVAAAFGNPVGGLKVDAGAIPSVGTGSIVGDDECRKRCGLI